MQVPESLAPRLVRALELMQEPFLLTTAQLAAPGPEILFANDAFCRLSGYRPEELLGRTPRILQGPRTDRAVIDRLRKSLVRGGRFNGRTWNYRKDGSEYLVEWQVWPLHDAQGRLTHFFSLQRDVTHEHRLEQRQRRLQEAVEQASDSVILFDPRGRVTYTNQAYRAHWLPAGQTGLGAPVWKLPGAPTRPEDFRWARHLLSRGQPWRRVVTVRRSVRQTHRVHVGVSPVKDDEGRTTGYVGILRDHTEYERLKEIGEARNVSEQLEAVFAEIRHEIGNPVNSIGSALSVLEVDDQALSPRQARYVASMRAEVERLRYLMVSLRSFGLFSELARTAVPLAPLISHLMTALAPEAERRGVRLEHHVEPEDLEVQGDAQALNHALVNLVQNAFDALEGHTGRNVLLEAFRIQSRVLLKVSDSGPGIPAAGRERVFLPFFTTKATGTGLGLPVVRKIITRMGGTIELLPPDHPSNVLRGAVFRIVLDATADPDGGTGDTGGTRREEP